MTPAFSSALEDFQSVLALQETNEMLEIVVDEVV
jgi:hypothetical protein